MDAFIVFVFACVGWAVWCMCVGMYVCGDVGVWVCWWGMSGGCRSVCDNVFDSLSPSYGTHR